MDNFIICFLVLLYVGCSESWKVKSQYSPGCRIIKPPPSFISFPQDKQCANVQWPEPKLPNQEFQCPHILNPNLPSKQPLMEWPEPPKKIPLFPHQSLQLQQSLLQNKLLQSLLKKFTRPTKPKCKTTTTLTSTVLTLRPRHAVSAIPGVSTKDTVVRVSTSSYCGRRHGMAKTEQQQDDVGGNAVEQGKWPWMAAIFVTTNEQEVHCGGSLISLLYVMSTATAFEDTNGRRLRRIYTVRLGDVAFKGEGLIRHQTFSVRHSSVSIHKESTKAKGTIAILRLNKKVVLNRAAVPICLPASDQLRRHDFAGAPVEFAGFGDTSSDKKSLKTAQLYDMKLTVLTNSNCRDKFPSTFSKIKHMCASSDQLVPAPRDEGGSLIWLYDKRYYAIGVMAEPDPSEDHLYFRVTSYVDWIIQNSDIETV